MVLKPTGDRVRPQLAVLSSLRKRQATLEGNQAHLPATLGAI